FCGGFGCNQDVGLIAEMVDQGRASIHRRAAGHSVTTLILPQPALVNTSGGWAVIGATKGGHSPLMSVIFEKGGQIFLSATRLGENHRLSWRAHFIHARKPGFQSGEQTVGLGIFVDAMRQPKIM